MLEVALMLSEEERRGERGRKKVGGGRAECLLV